jgi:hypothetical protein
LGRFAVTLLAALLLSLSFASRGFAAEPISTSPAAPEDSGTSEPTVNAMQMARLLKIVDVMKELKEKVATSDASQLRQSSDDLIQTLLLRQKLSRAVQYASLELEEALANIDGDIASNSMQLSFFSAKHDRSALLNGMATFIASGTLGVLDSSLGINQAAPIPNIFGIAGNSVAIGLPLLGLYPAKYKNPEAGQRKGNMLAPIFGRPYSGAGYDPLIWNYLEAIPAVPAVAAAASVSGKASAPAAGESRRDHLLRDWQSYRGLTKGAQGKLFVDQVSGVSTRDSRVSLDILKARSEFLVDLRAVIQQMYKDISDLNSYIMTL